jgi:hypothetical protein
VARYSPPNDRTAERELEALAHEAIEAGFQISRERPQQAPRSLNWLNHLKVRPLRLNKRHATNSKPNATP